MIRCRIRHPSSGRLSMLAMSSHATRRGPHGKNVPIPRVSGQRTGPPSKSNRAPSWSSRRSAACCRNSQGFPLACQLRACPGPGLRGVDLRRLHLPQSL